MLRKTLPALGLIAALLAWSAASLAVSDAEGAGAIAPEELRTHVDDLASDLMDGRLTGTPGGERATAYVGELFARFGLEPAGDDGSYFQSFGFTAGVSLGDGNRLGLDGRDLVLDRDWRPLAFSRSGAVAAAPVVFAGYGIVMPPGDGTDGYDSYAGLDVADKWVMVFRYLPEDVAPELRRRLRGHADLADKAAIARDKGAAGLIVVSGPNSRVRNELVDLAADAAEPDSGIAAVSVTDAIAEALLAPSGRSLKALQDALDRGETVPAATIADAVPAAAIAADIAIVREKRTGRNVLGRLPGGAGPDGQAVVIGAHVDHLGRGTGSRSLARDDEKGQIHYGADDNASGVAVLLAVARSLTALRAAGAPPERRDILFAAWSGEELGLLGSRHFAERLAGGEEATLRPEVAAYINIDMVGRLRDHLDLEGVGSSPAWPEEIARANQPVGLRLALQDDPYVTTDSLSFYTHGVPVLNLTTGMHEDYHTPRDTPDKLNDRGMAEVARLAVQLTRALADGGTVPDYVERPRAAPRSLRPRRVYMGFIPDYDAADGDGVRVVRAVEGGPAEAGGLQPGDVIVAVSGAGIAGIEDLGETLDILKIGEPVPVAVLRDGQRVTLTITPQSRE